MKKHKPNYIAFNTNISAFFLLKIVYNYAYLYGGMLTWVQVFVVCRNQWVPETRVTAVVELPDANLEKEKSALLQEYYTLLATDLF